LWAALVAVVDAVPILGTGTILIPWALVCLLQGKQLLAIGLLVIYGCTFVTRTALEPRLIGRSLNLDPLLTLLFLYVGFRFWGFLGLVFTPIVASAIISAIRIEKETV
jgi:predicted PurR-regulated permease PerM